MGEALALAALLLFSTNIILTNIAISKLSVNIGFPISIGMNVIFSLFLFILQISFVGIDNFSWGFKGVYLFILGGFFTTYLGRFFLFETIAKLGPTRASTFQISNPIFTTIIAVIFLRETLSLIDIASIIIIIIGLFLVSYKPSQEKKSTKVLGINGLYDVKIKKIIESGIILAVFSSLSYAIGNVLRGAAVQSWNEPILGGMLGALLGFLFHFLTNIIKGNPPIWKQIKDANRSGIRLCFKWNNYNNSPNFCYIIHEVHPHIYSKLNHVINTSNSCPA